MKATFRNLAAASLVAVGAGVLGWSADVANAQSACITDCRDKGWAFGQCSRYCETRYGEPNYAKRGPRVYGYSSGDGSGTCGQYRYRKGGQCVDARISPPKM
jgi:hypothetical protein